VRDEGDDVKNSELSRVSISIEKLDRLRRCVVHAQMQGDYTRTVLSSANEAVEMMIAKLEKKYGPPPADLPKPRVGRRLGSGRAE
jgi:hypothetical protein